MTSSMFAGEPCSSSNAGNDSETLDLLQRLQRAIISGQHTIAAAVAAELAKMKANCRMTMKRSEVQLTDKMVSEEPIRIRVQPDMTIGDLETQIYEKYKVPIRDHLLVLLERTLPISDRLELAENGEDRHENGAVNMVEGNIAVSVMLKDENDNMQVRKEEKWECSQCTFINEASHHRCVICESERRLQLNVPPYLAVNIGTTESEVPTEQEFSNYLELLDMEKTDLVTNLEEFECPICLTIHYPGDGVVLKTCLHTFCRDCLCRLIETSSNAEIRCPFVQDYSCDTVLQDREIRALVSTDVYNRYLTVSMNEAESKMANTFHCKTANCTGWCVFEDDVNVFVCPVCQQENCLTCQVIHTGYNCQQYQRKIQIESVSDPEANKTRLHLENMLEKGEAMTCPTCHIIILKKNGCDALTCTICKTEICWVTKGPRWGPMGPGDTSGGCQCTNWRRCHPQCNNCH